MNVSVRNEGESKVEENDKDSLHCFFYVVLCLSYLHLRISQNYGQISCYLMLIPGNEFIHICMCCWLLQQNFNSQV